MDGYWRMWSEWEACNVSCGGGIQMRSRTCVNPFHGGNTCDGVAIQIQNCNTLNCPGKSMFTVFTTIPYVMDCK